MHRLSEDTDLHLSVRGRSWGNSDARRNMPSGEVFTAPLETSANGHILFALPTLYGGQPVRGLRLTFRDGEVVDATAQEGEEVLRAALRTDGGIQRPSMNILFDEEIVRTPAPATVAVAP